MASGDEFQLTCIEDKAEYCKSKFDGFWFIDGCNDCVCKLKGFKCETGACKYHVNNVDEAFDYCDKISAKNKKLFKIGLEKKNNFTKYHFQKSIIKMETLSRNSPVKHLVQNSENHLKKSRRTQKRGNNKHNSQSKIDYRSRNQLKHDNNKSKIKMIIQRLENSRTANHIRGRQLKQRKHKKYRKPIVSYQYRKLFNRKPKKNPKYKYRKSFKRKSKKNRKYKFRKLSKRKYKYRKSLKRKYKYRKSFKQKIKPIRRIKYRKFRKQKFIGKTKIIKMIQRIIANHHASLKYLRKSVIKNRKMINYLKRKLVKMMRYSGMVIILQREVADLIITQKKLRLKLLRFKRRGRKYRKIEYKRSHRLKKKFAKMFKNKTHRKAFLRQLELVKNRQKKFYGLYERYFDRLNQASKYQSKTNSSS